MGNRHPRDSTILGSTEELKRMVLPRTAAVESPLQVGEYPRFLEDRTAR